MNQFQLSSPVIPLAEATIDLIGKLDNIRPIANMYGDINDLTKYMVADITHIYRTFFAYADIHDDIYVFATMTRSAQELLSDYVYILNNQDQTKTVKDYLEALRFGSHCEWEYLHYIKGLIKEKNICRNPSWTTSNRKDRINEMGGSEEVFFYNVLCAYAHHSTSNQRLIGHPEEIYVLRSYFLAKIIKYFYLLAKTSLGKVKIRSPRLSKAFAEYVREIDIVVQSWPDLFASIFEFTDKHGDLFDFPG